MNKTELIDAVATRSNTTKAQTTAMLNGLIEVIQANMANGDNVQLVKFKPGVALSEAVAGGKKK